MSLVLNDQAIIVAGHQKPCDVDLWYLCPMGHKASIFQGKAGLTRSPSVSNLTVIWVMEHWKMIAQSVHLKIMRPKAKPRKDRGKRVPECYWPWYPHGIPDHPPARDSLCATVQSINFDFGVFWGHGTCYIGRRLTSAILGGLDQAGFRCVMFLKQSRCFLQRECSRNWGKKDTPQFWFIGTGRHQPEVQ